MCEDDTESLLGHRMLAMSRVASVTESCDCDSRVYVSTWPHALTVITTIRVDYGWGA